MKASSSHFGPLAWAHAAMAQVFGFIAGAQSLGAVTAPRPLVQNDSVNRLFRELAERERLEAGWAVAEAAYLTFALVAAGPDARPSPLVLAVKAAGVPMSGTQDLTRALEDQVWSAQDNSLLIVDIDSFGGPTKVVCPLMAFRRANPAVAVILISEEFSGNDLGTHRLAICDASVMRSASSSYAGLALRAARQNNDQWRAAFLSDAA